MAANWLTNEQGWGTGDLTVEVGDSIRFRYRILLHRDRWSLSRLERAYHAWAAK